MTDETLQEEFDTQGEAEKHMATLSKKHPTSKHTVMKGSKSGKWHVVRHTSGGMSMVEDVEGMSFEDFLTEGRIETEHGAYRASHGKRAAGSGNWMIGVGTSNIDFGKHKEGEDYIQHNGPLGEAVKKAKEVAKKSGKTSVHILP